MLNDTIPGYDSRLKKLSQGRFCGQVINELIWKLTNVPKDRGVFSTRMPIKPVPFGALAG